jgi:hypothetical protein
MQDQLVKYRRALTIAMLVIWCSMIAWGFVVTLYLDQLMALTRTLVIAMRDIIPEPTFPNIFAVLILCFTGEMKLREIERRGRRL